MNISHTIISGNLTRPVELRTVGADKSVAKFTIAHNERFKKANGEQVEEVMFLDCIAWGKQGEIAAQYLNQGSLAVCEGNLKQENWEDKQSGQKRSKIVLNVTRVHLTGKPETATATATDTPARVPVPKRPAVGGSLPVDDANSPPFARENWIGA